jgi:ribosome-associated protein
MPNKPKRNASDGPDVLDSLNRKSKTQKKKEALSLQGLGERLVKMPPEQLEDIELPEEIYDAIQFAQTIKSHGAYRRQMQYIGALMRKIDTAPVEEALNNIEQGYYKRTLTFKEIENWRDELLAGNAELIEEILVKCPDVDRKKIAQLVQTALKEKEHNHPPRASRALFRYLRDVRSGQTDSNKVGSSNLEA